MRRSLRSILLSLKARYWLIPSEPARLFLLVDSRTPTQDLEFLIRSGTRFAPVLC